MRARVVASSLFVCAAFACSALAVFPFSFWKSASGVVGSCSPDSIGAGLKLWVKADALGLTDGTLVSTWTDFSGTSNSPTGSGSTRPVFHTGIINGLAALLFDGATTGMSFPNDPGAPTSTFIVAKTNIAASSAITYAAMVVTNSPNGLRVCHRLSGTNWGTYVGSDLSSGEDLVSGTPNILTMTTQTGGAANSTIIYRNGVAKANSTSVSSGGAPTNHIGYENANRFFSGYLAEIVIYSSILSTSNRQCVENWLGAKYAITVTH